MNPLIIYLIGMLTIPILFGLFPKSSLYWMSDKETLKLSPEIVGFNIIVFMLFWPLTLFYAIGQIFLVLDKKRVFDYIFQFCFSPIGKVFLKIGKYKYD